MNLSVGSQIGKLKVVEKTEERKNGYIVWDCVCECGRHIQLDTRTLQRQKITDCGCITPVKPGQRDITGQRFGLLTAVKPTGERRNSGTVVWLCKCDCGGEVLAPLNQLRAGYRKSCGCLSRPPLKDWINKHFGKLVVTEYSGKVGGMHQWKCLCECGNVTVVGQSRLLSGKTKSCGCLQNETILKNSKLIEGTSITQLESGLNRINKNNTSGHTGVYYSKKGKKWVAEIRFKGQYYGLGRYSDKKDAIKARQRGEEMHSDFIRWYYDEYIPSLS